jgi:DNA-directed RNA polymerase subunit K/omega
VHGPSVQLIIPSNFLFRTFMSDIKSKAQGLDANVQPRDVIELVNKTGNIYESISIVAKRARQISSDLKWEIQRKLEEFAVSSDTIEEVQENKEQIEISKFYERLPNTPIIATNEFLNNEIQWRYNEEKE